MPFVVPSNIVLHRGPCPPREGEIWEVRTPSSQITLALVINIIITIIHIALLYSPWLADANHINVQTRFQNKSEFDFRKRNI